MYHNKQPIALLLSTSILLTIPGCGPRYQSRQLTTLKTETSQFEQTNNQVTFRARKLSKKEVDIIFSQQAKYLITKKNPIIPVQCSISNASGKPVLLQENGINLRLVDTNEVIKRISTTNYYAYGIASVGLIGLIFSGAVAAGGIVVLIMGAYPWLFATGSVATGLFLIGTPFSIAESERAVEQYNAKIHKDIQQKVIQDTVMIEPGKTVNFILFADGKTFNPKFNVTVSHPDTKTLTNFDVNLLAEKSE